MDKDSVVALLLKLGTNSFTIGTDLKLRSKWSREIEVPIKRLLAGRLEETPGGKIKVVLEVDDGRTIDLYRTGELQIRSMEVK